MLKPKLIATIGGILISLSGVVSIILGIKINAPFYDVYPGGKMGHIGILAGVAAVVIGLISIFGLMPLSMMYILVAKWGISAFWLV